MKTGKLNWQQKTDWLQLALSENVGAITFHSLLKSYNSAALALKRLPVLAQRGGLKREIKLFPREKAEEQLEQAEKQKVTITASCEPDYPPTLLTIPDAPPVLWSKGNLHLAKKTCLAMVGSRAASANGIYFAKQLAAALGKHNYVIVSGLAVGIDSASHQASLARGTTAVVVGGLDVCYPQENAALQQKIADQGLLLAIHPLGTQIRPHYFVKRNFVIAGLSLATIVVECRLHSGSLTAARAAFEYGREVFAVPGSPFDPRARGCNKLLREQAIMVETVDDILNELNYAQPEMRAVTSEPSSPSFLGASESEVKEARKLIVSSLSAAPVTVDFLASHLQLAVAVVRVVLLELELAGRLERLRGDLVCAKYSV